MSLDVLEAAWAGVRETGEGTLVRLVGPGARALAARFCARHRPLARLDHDALPDAIARVAWFDGDGTALTAADRCGLFIAYHGAPWFVIATGPEVHTAGPRSLGVVIEVPVDDDAPVRHATPTEAVDVFTDDTDLGAVVERAVDIGDASTAYRAYDRMGRLGLERSQWDFVAVLRLAQLYRRDDAYEKATELAQPGAMRLLFAEVARVHHVVGEWRRAGLLAELSGTPYGDWIRSVILANIGRGEFLAVPATRHADRIMFEIADAMTRGDPVSPDGTWGFLYGEALAAEYGVGTDSAGLEALRAYCCLGRADDAWRVGYGLLESTSRYRILLHHGERPITVAVLTARHAILDGDPASALEALDDVEEKLASLTGVLASQARLLRACATALLDDRVGFFSAITRLVDESPNAPRRLGEVVESCADRMPDWARVRFYDLGYLGGTVAATPIVLGDFEGIEPIGAGGMGDVWRGRHAALGTPVAIKLVRTDDATTRARFEAEIEAVARLDHPAIVQVLDVGVVGAVAEQQTNGELAQGTPFLVMELADQTLEAFCGGLGWSEVHDILIALLDALAYAHARGVLHRDIKPANILCMDAPSGTTIRLSDFGLAGLETGRSVGTPAYMAPELWSGQPASWASDVYAVGCMAVHLLTGVPPFLGTLEGLAKAHAQQPPALDVPEIPGPAAEWIATLLEKTPGRRPSVQAAKASLEATSAVDAEGLPGRAPVAPTPSGSGTTFVLETLLGATPVPAFVEPPQAGELPEDWRDFRPHRPRLPTARLFGRGDPPLVGRAEVRDRLWALARAARHDDAPRQIALTGLAGSGRGALVRWLARRAGELGGGWTYAREEAPSSRPAVIDAGSLTPEDVEPWLHGAVVVVWTQAAPEGVERVALPPLHPLELSGTVLERIPLEAASLIRVSRAEDTLGRPGLALAHLDSVVKGAWIEPGSTHLRAPPTTAAVPRRVRAWWQAALAQDADEPTLEVLRAAAVLRRFRPHELEGMTGAPGAADRISGWYFRPRRALPDALRQVLIDGIRKPVRLHRRALDVFGNDPIRRAVHGAYVDPAAVSGSLVQLAADRRWDHDAWCAHVLDGAERALLATLVPARDPRWAPVELLAITLQRRRHSSLEFHARALEGHYERWRHVAPRWACFSAMRRAKIQRWGVEDTREWCERVATVAPEGDVEAQLAVASARSYFFTRRGQHRMARDAASLFREVTPDSKTRWLWGDLVQMYAQTVPLEQGVEVLRDVLDGPPDPTMGAAYTTWSAMLGARGDLDASLDAARLGMRFARGGDYLAALANVCMVLVMQGRREEVAPLTVEGIGMAAEAYPMFIGLFHRALFATHTDWPDRIWELAWRLLPPCTDPDAIVFLENGVRWALEDGRPERAAALEAELGRLRALG